MSNSTEVAEATNVIQFPNKKVREEIPLPQTKEEVDQALGDINEIYYDQLVENIVHNAVTALVASGTYSFDDDTPFDLIVMRDLLRSMILRHRGIPHQFKEKIIDGVIKANMTKEQQQLFVEMFYEDTWE